MRKSSKEKPFDKFKNEKKKEEKMKKIHWINLEE